jgi:hypothetical protein
MTSFLFKVVAVLTILFTACIALVHAQPYDDTQLHAFFAPPDNCPHPCFMGIRPGVTTVEQAMAILEAHEWIADVDRYEATDGRGVTSLTADWSGEQSEFIEGSEELWLGVEHNIVQAVLIPTRVPLGYIWLLFGAPDYGDIVFGAFLPSARYAAIYFDIDSIFVNDDLCPIESIWNLPVQWALRYDLSVSRTSQSHVLPVHAHQVCRNAVSNP